MAAKAPSPELQAILDELAVVAPMAAAKLAARRAAQQARNEAIVDAYLAGAKNSEIASIVGVSAPRITVLVKRGLAERQAASGNVETAQADPALFDTRKGSAA
ncbi:MAG: DNA-directed RNA polymerase specialized sigma24 family protein [Rhodococcus sp. (in: high G+C Gram-positive bacteria)]|jgi:DNA-directed RNA polymerase specialized sigma24 family protein